MINRRDLISSTVAIPAIGLLGYGKAEASNFNPDRAYSGLTKYTDKHIGLYEHFIEGIDRYVVEAVNACSFVVPTKYDIKIANIAMKQRDISDPVCSYGYISWSYIPGYVYRSSERPEVSNYQLGQPSQAYKEIDFLFRKYWLALREFNA